MKLFTLIFSFYMLGLSFLPCADVDECNNNFETMASIGVGHEKHSHDKEDCTPFCVCSCCATSIFFAPSVQHKIENKLFQNTVYPLYKISYSSSISLSIWQPPKLS
jgi:hypothetical protein